MFESLLIVTVALLTGALPPQAKKRDDGVITNPATGGTATGFQGEYLPISNSQIKAAAQVVAIGRDRFAVVILPGGLPGAGWDGKTRVVAAGVLEERTLVFKGGPRGQTWSGKILGTALTGKDPKGAILSMTKTARHSPTYRAPAPANSVILFNGRSTGQWTDNAVVGEGHSLVIATEKKRRDIVSTPTFGDFTLHLEFRMPLVLQAKKDKRAESGVFLQGRYEIQIQDSFGTERDKTSCGAIPNVAAPAIDASLPPFNWQSFDIDFRAARWDDKGKKTEPARVTVKHNGLVIHDNVELKGPTRGGDREKNSPGPIRIQDAGFPILYRNIWVLEKK